MPTTVVRSTIRARCHTPPLIQRCHHVWHTTGVSDGGCKPARHMWMVLWLTVPYRHCQLPEQCGVTLVISDSTMTDCPNHRLWHIMVKCHRPPMSHHTSMSTHSLPYIGKSSDWPQKPREEDMPQTLVTTSQTPLPEICLSLIDQISLLICKLVKKHRQANFRQLGLTFGPILTPKKKVRISTWICDFQGNLTQKFFVR